MTLTIARIGEHISLDAESDGLWIRNTASFALNDQTTWPTELLGSESGRLISIELDQLLEQGFAEEIQGQVKIPYSAFSTVRQIGMQCSTRWTQWSPFMLSISPIGDLGRRDFTYQYSFYLGARQVAIDRTGYYVTRKEHAGIYHLDDQTFALIESMDRFNHLTPEAKTEQENWLTFSVVKGCASEVGAELDRYLGANEVVVPSRIALGIRQYEDGSVSFVPRCSGVPDESFEKAFLALPEAEKTYSLDLPAGRRLRVILDDEQKEVLSRMKRVRHARGDLRKKAVETPEAFFDGVLQSVDLPYGRRVEGVGEFPFAPMPGQNYLRTGIFDGIERLAGIDNDDLFDGDVQKPNAVEITKAVGGDKELLIFPNPQAKAEFANRVKEALIRNQSEMDWQGNWIKVDEALIQILLPRYDQDELPDTRSEVKQATGKYLKIYTDENELKNWDIVDAQTSRQTPMETPRFDRPQALKEEVQLKAHQIGGIAWLQFCHKLRREKRRGGLLADDMGLGKTLQVLSYLAWCIENDDGPDLGLKQDSPPWWPILIIAPLMLVEDRTWEREMQHFFRGEGSVFTPITVLHGKNINSMKIEGTEARDLVAGRPSLDANKLRQFRVVVCNYETVVNYQHSFAQTLDGHPLWSIVITDEAHGYRTPNTKVSHAIKAIPCQFHVACTGTPVENRLLDVWNIFDAVQPALLGTAGEFSRSYEHPLSSAKDPSAVLHTLKESLLFDKPNTFLLRRDKSQLKDLPTKEEVRIFCKMGDFERQMHSDLLASLRHAANKKTHLGVLNKLAQLYQHRDLLEGNWEHRTNQELLERSAKLRAVVGILKEIKKKGEKVIIFSRFIAMQQILVAVLQEAFSLRVRVINGETAKESAPKSSANTSRARETRARILEDFRTKPGFDILILSPFVAGVGLTITEANHVIHYGRWWNPAIEAQATDRVYRIGQQRDVKVYLPIFQDERGVIKTSFDEAVDVLLRKKSDLARDFLLPKDGDDNLADELYGVLFGSDLEAKPNVQTMVDSEIRALSPFDFEALISNVWRSRGYETVLTPRGSDGGVDVIAVESEKVLLIQTKHSATKAAIESDAIEDLFAAQNLYQKYLDRPCHLVAVTNSKFTRECTALAAQTGIELIDGKSLLRYVKDAGTRTSDILLEEESRCPSFKAGLARVKSLMRHH
jgi:SNF2 family DNA or RNA helicase